MDTDLKILLEQVQDLFNKYNQKIISLQQLQEKNETQAQLILNLRQQVIKLERQKKILVLNSAIKNNVIDCDFEPRGICNGECGVPKYTLHEMTNKCITFQPIES